MESIAHRVLNIHAMSKIIEENEQLKDVHEKEIREQLLAATWNGINEYDVHILDYEYKQHMMEISKRGVDFVPVEKHQVAAQWDKLFTLLVSEKSKKRVKQYSDQYKWHVFSFGLLDALKTDEARRAFDTVQKDTLFIFYQYSEESFLVKNASLLKVKDLDYDSTMDKADIYIFDPVKKWTYVKTHESSCGPYFCCAN